MEDVNPLHNLLCLGDIATQSGVIMADQSAPLNFIAAYKEYKEFMNNSDIEEEIRHHRDLFEEIKNKHRKENEKLIQIEKQITTLTFVFSRFTCRNTAND